MPLNQHKVLLVYTSPISTIPLGLGYVAAMFEAAGFIVKIVVNTFRYPKKRDDFLHEINQFQPDLVGISYLTLGVLDVFDLARHVKKTCRIPIIAGGVHPSKLPEEALENGFDIVVRGEGEETVRELCRAFDGKAFIGLADISGISYKLGDKIVSNPDRARITDLDSLPYPARHLFAREDFRMPDNSCKGVERIFVGRGCPGRCTYCKAVFGPKYHCRSIENVVEEIAFVRKKYGTTDFSIGDDTFTHRKGLVRQFCRKIIDCRLNIVWTCGTRVTAVDMETLTLMKRAGCRTISFGAESGSDETLRRIKKGQTRAHIIKAVQYAHRAGIGVYVNIMTGFPWETPDHVAETIDLIHQIKPMVDYFSVLGAVVPVPNTEIYDRYHTRSGFTNYWLRREEVFQNAGQAIFQNTLNPYEMSVFYQRNMFDDSYIVNETFFNYSRAYKKSVRQLCFLIGAHNLNKKYPSRYKRKLICWLARLSRSVFEWDTALEIKLARLLRINKNKFHDIKTASLKRIQ